MDCYDCVCFDPPWYYASYMSWLNIALRLVKPNGKIMFPLFPYLLRPTASQERKDIFAVSRNISKTVISIPEFLEYDISTFEREELRHAEVDLRANWKMADFIILQGVTQNYSNCDNIKVDTEYLSWKEYNWFGIRWFIKDIKDKTIREIQNEQPLIKMINNSLF